MTRNPGLQNLPVRDVFDLLGWFFFVDDALVYLTQNIFQTPEIQPKKECDCGFYDSFSIFYFGKDFLLKFYAGMSSGVHIFLNNIFLSSTGIFEVVDDSNDFWIWDWCENSFSCLLIHLLSEIHSKITSCNSGTHFVKQLCKNKHIGLT